MNVDLLFVIDNSNSMRDNQATLARNVGSLLGSLTNPPTNPQTGAPRYPVARSIQIGVVSTDLGTPGAVVPSCANTDSGDDGLLNPIRNGPAMRSHQPWTTALPGDRPARCGSRPDQYPSFLTFETNNGAANSNDDVVCNAYLSIGGCGLEQPLESAYRALVVRNARAGVAGNMDPNAGFVRNDAVLAIVLVTDEEDGSVRDCRYAEPGDPDGVCRPGGRGAALDVFDSTNPNWATADLNLRFYMYSPGSRQDPTWSLDRYIDPLRPSRGFPSLKPGRPELVVFSAITGVPINLPRHSSTTDPEDFSTINWIALLGNDPRGGEGFVGNSAEGPVSMRQGNADQSCATRVVPACRREGSAFAPPACSVSQQYFAWPARRIAEVARRFEALYPGNGSVSSICRNDYSSHLRRLGEQIGSRFQPAFIPNS
jgi:hypothetical protein